MKSSPIQLFKHPIVLASIGLTVLIALASAYYYAQATRVPEIPASLSGTASSTLLTASGVVAPAQNPDLTFAAGGRVVFLHARVGDQVSAGELLASLDTAALEAQRAQAQANVEAARARLADMLAGAKATDIAAKQTAIAVANTTLTNLYGTVATNEQQAYDKSFSGFSQYTDALFNQPNSSNPSLIFQSTNSQIASTVVSSRIATQAELSAWQSETATLSDNPSTAQVESALTSSLSHLQTIRAYADQLLVALSSGVGTSAFPQSSISSAQISVAAYRDSINAQISSLQSAQQQIASQKLAVQAAQDALNQTTASSTPQQIAAQQAAIDAALAQERSISAQIQNQIITAPFSGTIASVHIKTGDVVGANTPALSLNSASALQVEVYFSEIDITKVHVGDAAKVTLDAYGNDRIFPATVVSVDAAPTTEANGTQGYKATLQFLSSDSSVSSGMTANITLSK